jgi:hypothetical protein
VSNIPIPSLPFFFEIKLESLPVDVKIGLCETLEEDKGSVKDAEYSYSTTGKDFFSLQKKATLSLVCSPPPKTGKF